MSSRAMSSSFAFMLCAFCCAASSCLTDGECDNTVSLFQQAFALEEVDESSVGMAIVSSAQEASRLAASDNRKAQVLLDLSHRFEVIHDAQDGQEPEEIDGVVAEAVDSSRRAQAENDRAQLLLKLGKLNGGVDAASLKGEAGSLQLDDDMRKVAAMSKTELEHDAKEAARMARLQSQQTMALLTLQKNEEEIDRAEDGERPLSDEKPDMRDQALAAASAAATRAAMRSRQTEVLLDEAFMPHAKLLLEKADKATHIDADVADASSRSETVVQAPFSLVQEDSAEVPEKSFSMAQESFTRDLQGVVAGI